MYRGITLTQREQEIVQLIKDIPTLKELANKLGISYRTLQWHLTKLYAKFRVQNRCELIVELIQRLPDSLAR